MLARATVVWVIGLLTLVPYGTWRLLFVASRDEYPLLITLILFWILGYWGLVAPLLMAVKVRSVLRSLESAQSTDALERGLRSPAAREVAIDLIAAENRIPRFLANRVFDLLIARLPESARAEGGRRAEDRTSNQQ